MPLPNLDFYLIPPTHRFDVFDSLGANANPFLLHRDTSQATFNSAEFNSTALSASLEGNVPQPGEPNRWAVGTADLKGMLGVTELQDNLKYMSDIKVRGTERACSLVIGVCVCHQGYCLCLLAYLLFA